MPKSWDWVKDWLILNDIDKVKKRLNKLRVLNSQQKDIQQWMNRCLWYAAWNGTLAVCEYLVGQGGDPTWRHDGLWAYTAFHLASLHNHVCLLQLLMDGGWSPEVTDSYGLTPLWWAAYFGYDSCVEVLLSKGANSFYKRKQSGTNLSWLSNEVSCNDSPLVASAKRNHGNIVFAMMQEIIKACRSVASAGGEAAATMTDVSRTCQVQQLTNEFLLLSAVVAEKDEQIHSLARTVNDLKEELTAKDKELVVKEEELMSKDRQISFLSKAWENVKKCVAETDKQVNHVFTGTSTDCLLPFVAQCPETKASASYVPSQYPTRYVLRAVQRFSSSRWYALGRECEQTNDELFNLRSLTTDADKVQALFDQIASQIGEAEAAGMLLAACGKIEKPTLAAVKKELEKMGMNPT